MAVRDTGEGISPEDRPFVFDRFYRGDPSREGRGAGLGLAIARGLAAAHRGVDRPGLDPGRGQHLHAQPADVAARGAPTPAIPPPHPRWSD